MTARARTPRTVSDVLLQAKLATLEKVIRAARAIAKTLDPFQATGNIVR